jgi:hypothetical protein
MGSISSITSSPLLGVLGKSQGILAPSRNSLLFFVLTILREGGGSFWATQLLVTATLILGRGTGPLSTDPFQNLPTRSSESHIVQQFYINFKQLFNKTLQLNRRHNAQSQGDRVAEADESGATQHMCKEKTKLEDKATILIGFNVLNYPYLPKWSEYAVLSKYH